MVIEVDGERGPIVELLRADEADPDPAALKARARDWAAGDASGVVSRSYCFPFALVGRHTDRIGVDVERIVPCDERFGRSICTPAEEAGAPWRSDDQIISLWSSKEALAKALGDALRYDPRRLESPAGWTDGASGRWRARPVQVADGYCAWVCWRESAGG
jgi:phosphopantetheinyl transferase